MALIKCPECGKMISERATICPECGCPKDYFEREKSEEISKITFHIAGYDIDVPGEQYLNYAKVFGVFAKLSYSSVSFMNNLYDNSKNIETALENVPSQACSLLNATIESAIQALYSMGIHMTAEEFLEKHYYNHRIDYEQYYNRIVEKYASIMDYKEELKNYREAQIASRGRWVGGGFGIKGAIKGAISASLMNAASDFIHSFGDIAQERADNKKIHNLLKDFYELSETKSILCDSIGECIWQVYFALIEELKLNRILPKHIFCFDVSKAHTIYEHTLKYEDNDDAFIGNIIQCITLWPGEKAFYDSIIGNIYANLVECTEESNFYSFLDYWGLEDLFEETLYNDVQTAEQIEFVDRITAALKGSALENDGKVKLENIPFKQLSLKEQKELISKFEEPCIANIIILKNDLYFLSDVLISDYINAPIMISNINKIFNSQEGIIEKDGTIFDSGNIVFEMKDSTKIVWNKKDKGDSRNIVAIINFGINADNAEKEWKNRLDNYEFEKKLISNNIPIAIYTLDDYVNGMKYYVPAIIDSSNCLRDNARASLLHWALYKWQISGDAKEIAWIPSNIPKDIFWKYISYISISNDYWNELWFFHIPDDDFEPWADVKKQLVQYGNLLLYKNFGSIKPSGFALTDKYIIILNGMIAIKLCDICAIKIADANNISICNKNKNYLIKVSGVMNLDECNWNNQAKLQHILNIIILYIIRYGDNQILRLDIEKNQIEDFDIYMNKLGISSNSIPPKEIIYFQKVIDAIYGYLQNNNFTKPVVKKRIQGERNKAQIDTLTMIHAWSRDLDWNIISEPKIFSNIPQFHIEEYWKTICLIVEIVSNVKFLDIVAGQPNDERLIKILNKANVNPKDVTLYCIIEGLFSFDGFAITKDVAVDFKKKTKIYLKDVIELIDDDDRFYILKTATEEIRLTFFNAENVYDNGRAQLFAKLIVTALMNYIDKIRNSSKHSLNPNNHKYENYSDSNSDFQTKRNIELMNTNETIFCPYCGKKILRTTKFCNFCGKQNKYAT